MPGKGGKGGRKIWPSGPSRRDASADAVGQWVDTPANSIGIFLGDVQYFVEDVLMLPLAHGIRYLLTLALDPAVESDTILNGSQALLQSLDSTATGFLDRLQPCPAEKPVVFVARSESEAEHSAMMSLFQNLQTLRFLGGSWYFLTSQNCTCNPLINKPHQVP